jgi:hypothetical protein
LTAGFEEPTFDSAAGRKFIDELVAGVVRAARTADQDP